MSEQPVAVPAPEETALYHIHGDADLLLYIGISNNFGSRWKQEASAFPWWGEKRWMTVRWYGSRPEAEAAEKAAIRAEKPKHNVMHNVIPGTVVREPHPYDEWFGARVREQRQVRRMSQAALAAEMAGRGYSWHQSTAYRIEVGRQPATFSEVVTLSEVFGFPDVDAFAMPDGPEAGCRVTSLGHLPARASEPAA